MLKSLRILFKYEVDEKCPILNVLGAF